MIEPKIDVLGSHSPISLSFSSKTSRLRTNYENRIPAFIATGRLPPGCSALVSKRASGSSKKRCVRKLEIEVLRAQSTYGCSGPRREPGRTFSRPYSQNQRNGRCSSRSARCCGHACLASGLVYRLGDRPALDAASAGRGWRTCLHREPGEADCRPCALPCRLRSGRNIRCGRQQHREIVALGRELRAAKYDLCVDMQGLMRSSLVGRMSGTPQYVGRMNPRESPAKLLYQDEGRDSRSSCDRPRMRAAWHSDWRVPGGWQSIAAS